MRNLLANQSRVLAQLSAASVALCVVILVALSSAAPASAAEGDLRCSATAEGNNIALAWSASDESPTVHVRQLLNDGSSKWRRTTEQTATTLPGFAFGEDAEYIIRYRLDAGVQDVPCESGVTPPPPPPANGKCIQVEIDSDDAYLTWEGNDASRYAVRRITNGGNSWVSTVETTHATVPAGESYAIRSNGADIVCDSLLDLDNDPTFTCSMTPLFSLQMRLQWSDDGSSSHQIRKVNVEALEDQFHKTGQDNTRIVNRFPLYFIRRASGDTPCLPVAADGSALAPCVINSQPRSIDLNAADCLAVGALVDAGTSLTEINPCNDTTFCKDRKITEITIDLKGAPVPSAVGDLEGLRNLRLLNATGVLPQKLEDAPLYGLTLGGTIELPDLSELGDLTELTFIGAVPDSNLDTLSAKNVFVTDLAGEIPERLASIEGMKRLTISATGSTTIPQSVIVDTLRELRVSGDGVTGSLPAQNALQILDLSDTSVSGAIPANYATSSLRELSLTNTLVSGALPDFGQTRRLTILDIGNAELTGAIPAGIGDSSTLVTIDLRGNNLSGDIPGELAQITTLRTLDLRKNELTGELPNEFGSLDDTFLRLDLSNNQIAGTIPSSWTGLEGAPNFDGFSRFEIDLANNQLTGPLPTFTGREIVFYDLRGNLFEGDITNTVTIAFANDLNFRWVDGAGGNNCLTVTDSTIEARLDNEQPGWDRCD